MNGLDEKLDNIVKKTLGLISEMYLSGTERDRRDCEVYAKRFLDGMVGANEELRREYFEYYQELITVKA